MHVVETGRHVEDGGLAADAGHTAGHGGEERMGRLGEAGEILGDFGDGDLALRDLTRGGGEEGAEVAFGGGLVFDGEDAAVDGEAREGGHGVDLAAGAGGELAAEVEGGAHGFALGGDEAALGEAAGIVAEGEDERGHFFEGVDAALGQGAVGGAAVDGDFEPERAVVAAADLVEFAALHDDGVVGFDRRVFDEPAGAEDGIGFLVGGERDLDVEARGGAGGAEGLEGEEEARDGALHVGRAAAVDPAGVDGAAERAAVSPGAGDGDDVVVGVEVEGFFRAGGGELAEDVVAREGVLRGREGLAEERARNREAAGAQAEGGEVAGELGGDRVVVFAGRIDGGDPHEPAEAGEEVGGVEVDVGRRSHGAEGVPGAHGRHGKFLRFAPVAKRCWVAG